MTVYLAYGTAGIYLKSQLEKNTELYGNSMEQISSGTRYTSIGENPTDISKAVALRVEISATAKALSNVQLGNDLLTIAGENQNTIISELQRIRDLCTQAANGTYSVGDKDSIIDEIKQRLNQIDDIADTTKFEDINLLDGTATDLTLQIGTDSSSSMEVGNALINSHCSQLGGDIRLDDTITGATWTTDDIKAYQDQMDLAIEQLTTSTSQMGSYQNRLALRSNTLNVMNENLAENKSLLVDTDVAKASTQLIKYQLLQQATVSILTQANQVHSMVFNLLHQ